MTHFSDADWANFVRGLAVDDERAMLAHLDACDDCTELVGALRSVRGVAMRDAAAQPPDHVLHSARAIFAMWTPDTTGFFAQAARLVFDSLAAPAFAGIRSGQPAFRQLLYEAPPYSIDVRIDSLGGGQLALLTGQIVSADAGRTIGFIDVRLTADQGRRTVGQTRTNAAGEFHFEYQPAPRLQLRLDGDAPQRIDLPSDVIMTDDRELTEE